MNFIMEDVTTDWLYCLLLMYDLSIFHKGLKVTRPKKIVSVCVITLNVWKPEALSDGKRWSMCEKEQGTCPHI